MTGVFLVRSVDAVHLYTDGAGCDEHGRLAWVGSKVLLMPEWPGAVAVRGNCLFLWMLRTAWNIEVPTFDDARDRIVYDALQVAAALGSMGYPDPDGWEVILAGWSDRSQSFEVWDVHGQDQVGADAEARLAHPPLIMRLQDGLTAAWPVPDLDVLRPLWPRDKVQLEPRDMAFPFMQAMRLKAYPQQTDPERLIHGVGGFIQETVLGREGCTSSIVHRWPDVVGEPIRPSDGAQP